MNILNKLFENPSKTLQIALKALFAVNVSFGALCLIVYEIFRAVWYAQVRNPGMVVVSILLIFILPVIYVVICYISTLFTYTILSFFADIHNIATFYKEKLK